LDACTGHTTHSLTQTQQYSQQRDHCTVTHKNNRLNFTHKNTSHENNMFTLAMPDSSTMTKSSAWAVLVKWVPPQNSIEKLDLTWEEKGQSKGVKQKQRKQGGKTITMRMLLTVVVTNSQYRASQAVKLQKNKTLFLYHSALVGSASRAFTSWPTLITRTCSRKEKQKQ